MHLYDSHFKIRFLPKGFPQTASYLNVKMRVDNNLVIKIWHWFLFSFWWADVQVRATPSAVLSGRKQAGN